MEFFKKFMEDKKKLKAWGIIGIVVVIVFLIIGISSIVLISNFNFRVTVEAGEEFNADVVWKGDFKLDTTVAGEINTQEIGTYKCLIKVLGFIPMNVTVDVRDTMAPMVITKDVLVNYGESCKPEDFILECKDVSGVMYDFVTEPDYTKLGPRTVTIKVTDVYGNSTTETAELTVKGIVSTYTMEVGSGVPPAKSFVLDESIEVSYVTEPDAESLKTPGEYTVQLFVQGVTENVIISVVDTTAPSINTSYIKVTVNGTLSYKKSINVSDNCDSSSEIVLDIDNSAVNLSAAGSYVVHCTAKDTSGNTSSRDITVQVVEAATKIHTLEEINAYADSILAQIIDDSMSTRDKAYAIYKWTRSSIGYVNNSPKGDWLQGAYDGMVKRSGDCFTYAATAKALLERIGLAPLVITKEVTANTSQNNHYWLLLDLGDGYYHYDPTRRADGTWFFMWTDAELLAYSNNHWGSHNFTRSKYPEIQ